MAIDFSRIKKSFNKIEEAINVFMEVDIGGVEVKLRHLSEKEETEIISIVHSSISDGLTSVAKQQQFISNMKVETLSRAIVKIGDSDFEKDGFVEVIEDGEKVIREKNYVIKQFLNELPKPFLSRVFSKYGDLIARIEINSERLITYEVDDLDAEIKRLKDKIKDLEGMKRTQEERKKSDSDNIMNMITKINDAENNLNSNIANEGEESESESQPQPQEEETKEPSSAVEEEERVEVAPPVQERKEERRNNPSPASDRPQVKAPPQGVKSASHNLQPEDDRVTQVGKMVSPDGKEIDVYKTPTQTISSRGSNRPQGSGQFVVNKSPSAGNTNPNFNPRKG